MPSAPHSTSLTSHVVVHALVGQPLANVLTQTRATQAGNAGPSHKALAGGLSTWLTSVLPLCALMCAAKASEASGYQRSSEGDLGNNRRGW